MSEERPFKTHDQEEYSPPTPVLKPTLPQPTVTEGKAIVAATQRVRARRDRTQLECSPTQFDTKALHPPHSDLAGFTFQLRDAFGTTSKAFVSDQLKHIIRVVGNDNGKADTDAVNAVIAMVDGLRPENELEAAAAVQIALTHSMSLDMLGRASLTMQPEHRDRYLNLATKLQRTLVAQMEALTRLRSRPGGSQVGQVTVTDGGQAIVGGTVNVQGGGGDLGG